MFSIFARANCPDFQTTQAYSYKMLSPTRVILTSAAQSVKQQDADSTHETAAILCINSKLARKKPFTTALKREDSIY